jgi:hypothetical protein
MQRELTDEQLAELVRTVRVRRTMPRAPVMPGVLIVAGLLVMFVAILSPFALLAASAAVLRQAVPIAATGFLLGLAMLVTARQARARFKHRILSAGGLLCLNCHYDLRGSPERGFCPECREPYSHAEVKRDWELWQPGMLWG